MRNFLKYWLPLLICLGVIFVGSTDLMSAEHTSRFIVPTLLTGLLIGMSFADRRPKKGPKHHSEPVR
jgi:hypothetical protein